jgi:hypothetical protein
MRDGERMRKNVAGKQVKNISSNWRVKSKDRQGASIRGPNDLSLPRRQLILVALVLKLWEIEFADLHYI